MSKKLTSIIWTISAEHLQMLLDSSNSHYEILPKLGLSKYSAGSFEALKRRINNGDFDLSKFNNNRINNPAHKRLNELSQVNKIPIECILVENGRFSRHHLKDRIIKENLIDYKCEKCGNSGEWCGEKINLQLDHKNGINNDNRLENLRLLCPNCHSQTHNFCGRNKVKKENHCKNCGCIVTRYSILCRSCKIENDISKRKLKVTIEELQELIKQNSWQQIADLYNVSEVTVRKLAKKYNLDTSHKYPGCHAVNNSLIHKLSKEELENELNENSLSKLQIKYKCGTQTINKLIKKYSIEYCNHGPKLVNEEEKIKIIELYKSGKTISQIRKETKRDRQCIRDLLKKENIYTDHKCR